MNKKAPFVLVSTVLAGAALAVYLGRARAARQLRQDVARLLAAASDSSPVAYQEAQLAGPPAPVQRYFRHVLRDGQPYLRNVRLRHNGQFKTALNKSWVDIEGEEYLTAEPPAFLWQGSTSQFTARDEYVAGRGGLTVRLFGAVPVLHAVGPHYDQGELLRWLGECTWLPTALLPGSNLHWTAIDDHSAQVTFTHLGQTATYLMRFNEQDEIAQCETQRYQGGSTLLPWVGRASRYRKLHGVPVPTQLEGSWIVYGKSQPYARFTVQELEFDVAQPY